MWIEMDAMPWDDGDPVVVRARRVLEALRAFDTAEREMRERTASVMHATHNELAALRYVIRMQEAGVPVTPTDLAVYLGAKTAAVTIMVDHLEAHGHLRRRAHPTDRRRLLLEATPEAMARVRALFAPMRESVMAVSAILSDDDAHAASAFLEALAQTLDTVAVRPAMVPAG